MSANQMKALVKSKAEPGLWMEYVPVPEPGPDEVLVKVRKSAICGTDVHIWKWDEWSAKTVPVPMVVGHEFCGEIVDSGPAARKYTKGQRVAGEGHIVCGACRNCRAGRGHLCRNTLGVGVNNSNARNFTYLASTGMRDFHAIPRPGSAPVDDLAWADERDVLIAMTCSSSAALRSPSLSTPAAISSSPIFLRLYIVTCPWASQLRA